MLNQTTKTQQRPNQTQRIRRLTVTSTDQRQTARPDRPSSPDIIKDLKKTYKKVITEPEKPVFSINMVICEPVEGNMNKCCYCKKRRRAKNSFLCIKCRNQAAKGLAKILRKLTRRTK